MKQCIFNWSGGKDSALALYRCMQDPDLEIKYLVTTINDKADRISMHGVRTELLVEQAESIGIPLYQIRLPEMPGMQEYDAIMQTHLTAFAGQGITHAIFGDIFLEDLRNYRDARLNEAGLTGLYPLWQQSTLQLVNEFREQGFGTVIVCVQERLEYLVGKELTPELIARFPDDIDVCGENGEFHTFTFKGPIFKKSINYKVGEKIYKAYNAPILPDGSEQNHPVKTLAGFWYCDILSA